MTGAVEWSLAAEWNCHRPRACRWGERSREPFEIRSHERERVDHGCEPVRAESTRSRSRLLRFAHSVGFAGKRAAGCLLFPVSGFRFLYLAPRCFLNGNGECERKGRGSKIMRGLVRAGGRKRIRPHVTSRDNRLGRPREPASERGAG